MWSGKNLDGEFRINRIIPYFMAHMAYNLFSKRYFG